MLSRSVNNWDFSADRPQCREAIAGYRSLKITVKTRTWSRLIAGLAHSLSPSRQADRLKFFAFVGHFSVALTSFSQIRWILLFVVLGQTMSLAQTSVDLTAKPKIFARSGALISVSQNAEGTGSIISVEYPNGEGGGNVVFKTGSFDGPLGRLTLKAKGSAENWRVGIRGSSKEASSLSVDFDVVSEDQQAYSLDFASVLQKANAAGVQLQYPITDLVFGFRYTKNQKEVIEICDLIIHVKE